MSRDDIEKFILSIGFKYNGNIGDYYYNYKEFVIYLYDDHYDFYNGIEWFDDIDLNDLRPLDKEFKKELRSIKLKGLLR